MRESDERTNLAHADMSDDHLTCKPLHQGDTRRLEAVMRRLMDGEPITVAAVGGSVTGAHGLAALMSCWPHAVGLQEVCALMSRECS